MEYVKESKFEITVPKVDNYFYHNEKDNKVYDYIYKGIQQGQNNNIMLVGPHGCGKSESCKQFAAKRKLKFFETNCSLYREPREFFGIKGAYSGNTYFQKAQLIKAFETENCVILLDEINRCASSVANSLYSLLDDRRDVYFDEIGYVKVAKGVTIFASKNTGLRYTGTSPSDISLMDRFKITLEVDFLPELEEIKVLVSRTNINQDDAYSLVKFANAVRSKAAEYGSSLRNTISTRILIGCAEMYNSLGTHAIDCTIIPLFSKEGGNDSERSQVFLIKQMIFDSTLLQKEEIQ